MYWAVLITVLVSQTLAHDHLFPPEGEFLVEHEDYGKLYISAPMSFEDSLGYCGTIIDDEDIIVPMPPCTKNVDVTEKVPELLYLYETYGLKQFWTNAVKVMHPSGRGHGHWKFQNGTGEVVSYSSPFRHQDPDALCLTYSPFERKDMATYQREKCQAKFRVVCGELRVEVLFVAGGSTPSTEVVAPSDYPDLSCPRSPAFFPETSNVGYSVSFSLNGQPVLCGSYGGNCYFYNIEADRWDLHPNRVSTADYGSNAARLGDNFLIGPLEYSTFTKIWISDTGEIVDGPRLPFVTQYFCMVARSHHEVIVVGGYSSFFGDGISDIMQYDSRTGTWTKLGEMLRERSDHMCFIENNKLVIAGGVLYGDASGMTATVEIMDLDTYTVRRAPDLPYPMEEAAFTRSKKGWLLVGGRRQGNPVNTFLFDDSTEEFIEATFTIRFNRGEYPFAQVFNHKELNCTFVA